MDGEKIRKELKDIFTELEDIKTGYIKNGYYGLDRVKEFLTRVENFALEVRYYNAEFGDFDKERHKLTEVLLQQVKDTLSILLRLME